MPKLGVNIDHIATLRQARRESDPDPVKAAQICEQAGADSIVAHLREDRRHINDQDIRNLKKVVRRFNLELSLDPEIIQVACALKPHQATIVPERRQEITTEGGISLKVRLHRNFLDDQLIQRDLDDFRLNLKDADLRIRHLDFARLEAKGIISRGFGFLADLMGGINGFGSNIG